MNTNQAVSGYREIAHTLSSIGSEDARFRACFSLSLVLETRPLETSKCHPKRLVHSAQRIGYAESRERDHDGGNAVRNDWGGDMLRHAIPRA